MKRDQKAYLTEEEISFAHEIVDMLELRISQSLELLDHARRELKEIEWIKYEEDFNERIKQFLAGKQE